MDKRFTDKNQEAGSEPPLLYILEHYYTSHGIAFGTAQKLAGEYIEKWVEQERSSD